MQRLYRGVMIQLTISNDVYNKIMDCIHSSYQCYTGNHEIDEDVYEFNSSLDELLNNIRENTEETEC